MAKLEDLYQRGQAETITDDDGNVSKFYLKKLNPVDQKTCIVKSNAVRARFLTAQRDKDSDDYLSLLTEVMDMDEEKLKETAVSKVVAEKAGALEEEIKAEDRWSKDDYLETIKDEWEDKSKFVWIDSREREDGSVPDHSYSEEEVATAERIFAELNELSDLFDEAIDKFRKSEIRSLSRVSREELEEKALDVLFDRAGNAAWVETWYKWQVYFATCDHKTKERYFSSFEKFEQLPLETYLALLTAFRKLEIGNTEVKK